MGCAVGSHPRDQEHIARSLGMLESLNVVSVIGTPIALERCEQRQDCVSHGQSLGVTDPTCTRHGLLGLLATQLGFAPHPVDSCGPCKQ